MAAKDHFSWNIECPKCSQKGELDLSEDDYPFMRNPHRTIDRIHGNFQATCNDGVIVSITCNGCGAQFNKK